MLYINGLTNVLDNLRHLAIPMLV